MTRFNAKDKLVRIKPNVIVSIVNKYRSKVSGVISKIFYMRRKIVKIWLDYVLNIVKFIGHSLLEGGTSVFRPKWSFLYANIPQG